MNSLPRHLRALLFSLLGLATVTAGAADWPMSGAEIENTRSVKGGPINGKSVDRLKAIWEFQTIPDTGDANTPLDAIASTPVVDGDFIYFTDFQGYLFKLNRFTGREVWRKSFLRDLSAPGFVISEGRGSPYVTGNLIIIGNSFHMQEQLCPVVGSPEPVPGRCHSGNGAIVVAVNKYTGQVVWRQKVDQHPAAKVSSSISGFNKMIFVPVSHWEEEWARTYPNIYVPAAGFGSVYPCCSARGSVVALDVRTGRLLWKRYLSIGNDAGGELAPEVRALLFGKGYFGVSTYGHNPAIDVTRKLVYVATSQSTTTPTAVAACEKARRSSGNPNANIDGVPAGVTCNNLNEKLKTYGSAIIALDMNDGTVKWAFYARKYDAWNHACDGPDWGLGGGLAPLLVPVPANNAANCSYDPIGAGFGFGMQPALVKNVKLADGKNVDLVVAGNKDGRLFALNADNGRMVWERDIDPGGILGGLQYGLATDGRRIYVGSANSSNTGRDIHTPFVPLQAFLDYNGLSDPPVGLRTGLMARRDGESGHPRPAPGPFLPFPGPNLVYSQLGYPANIGYPDTFPPLIGNFADHFLKRPASGPWSLWSLINPPPDVAADGVNVLVDGGRFRTIAGIVSAVNVSDGSIIWQRPAVDGIGAQIAAAPAQGSVTIVNDVVLAGYMDGKGTMMALDSATGVKQFEFHPLISAHGTQVPAGAIEAGPAVVEDTIYWGVGSYTGAPLLNKSGLRYLGGNRVIALRPRER